MKFDTASARRCAAMTTLALVMTSACSTGAVEGQTEAAPALVSTVPATLAVSGFDDVEPVEATPATTTVATPELEPVEVDESFDPTVAPDDLTDAIEAPAPNPQPVVELEPDPLTAQTYSGMTLTLHQCCDTTSTLGDLGGSIDSPVTIDNGVFFGSWTLEVPPSAAVSSWSVALTLPDHAYAFSTNNEQFTLQCTAGACADVFGNESAAIVTDRRYQAVVADFDVADLPTGTYTVRLSSQPGDILEVQS